MAAIFDADTLTYYHYATLQDAVDCSGDEDEIQLIANVDITSVGLTIPSEKSVLLDLLGYTITAGCDEDNRINIQGALTLQDNLGLYNDSDYVGKIVSSGLNESPSGEAYLITVEPGGRLNIIDGLIDCDTSSDDDNLINAIGVKSGGTFTMQGGRIVAGGYALSGISLSVDDKSLIELIGGEVSSNNSFAFNLTDSLCDTRVSSAKVYGAAGGINIQEGSLELTNGCIVTSKGLGSSGEWGAGSGSSDAPALYVDGNTGNCNVLVVSGTLTAAPGADAVRVSKGSQAVITINGGTYSKQLPENLLSEEYTYVENDGNYLVVPTNQTDAVAAIYNRYYNSLYEALNNASSGNVVVLLKDAPLGQDAIDLNYNIYVTLNLGGHTLTDGQINVRCGEFIIENGTIAPTSTANPLNLYCRGDLNGERSSITIKKSALVDASNGYGICVMPSDDSSLVGFNSEVSIEGKVKGSKGGIYVSDTLGGSSEAWAKMSESSDFIPLIRSFARSEISGGSTGPGIDLNGAARVEIYDGANVGGTEAVRVKRGILDVFGGNLTAVGDAAVSSQGTELASEDTGAAVSITSKHSDFGIIDVTIESGTLRSEKGAAVYLGHSANEDGLIPFGVSPSLKVRYGFFSGKNDDVIVAPAIDGDASYSQKVITGGLFANNPEGYVDNHYEVLNGGLEDTDEYKFVINGPLEPTSGWAVEGPTIVDSSELSPNLDDATREAVLGAAASVVADSGVLAGAAEQNVYEIDANVAEQAIDAYQQSGIAGASSVPDGDITVYVQAYLAVTPLDCDATARTLTLDIAPMYRVVASTAASGEEIKVLGEVSDGANAVVLGGSEKSLSITSSFDYSMNPPVSILPLEDSHLFVKNISDDFADSYRKAGVDVDSGAISFWRNAGLSTFEIRYDDRLAPVTYGNYTRNLRLDWVGDEIFSAPATSEGQEFLGWSFAKYIGGNEVYQVLTDDLLTDLSEYYAVHPYEKIWAEPQFDPPMTEPDPDPEPTPDPDPTPTPTPDPKPDGDVVTNPDGSTTTTTTEESTDPDTGDVTTVVTEVTEGREDGSVTTVVTETVKSKDGATSVTVTETTELADGTVATAASDGEGRVSSVEATVTAEAAAAGPVALPVPALTAVANEGSAVEISVSAPEGGATVVVPVEDVTPSAVLELVGADGSVTVLPKVALSEDGLAIALEEGATLRLVDRETSFPDVSEGDWYAEEVAPFVSSRGILTGVVTEGGTAEFRGGLGTDRAMFVTMLHRLELEPAADGGAQFGDVPEGAWYAGAASWGDGTGVVAGYGDGTAFGGADPVTREQMAVFMFRYARWLGLDTSARAGLDFPDGASVSSWASEAMSWAVAEGLFTGDAGTGALRPTDGATRAEAAAVIMRLVNGVLL